MIDLFTAKDPVIMLLRVAAMLAALLLIVFISRRELRGLALKGRSWVREEAELARTKTGYVAAILGRNSTLLGGCTFVFAVFRTEHFTAPAARTVAMLLSTLSIIAGLFIGLMVIAITHEIVRQTRDGE